MGHLKIRQKRQSNVHSNGPNNRGLSGPEIGEPEHNKDLLTLLHEGDIIYKPTCKANVTKVHTRRGTT
jgi:hypothetical protein